MYILKNALKNLSRNKGRNILIGMIIFVLILSTTVSLVINSTTKEIINDYKNRFGSKVSINLDIGKMSDANGNFVMAGSDDEITSKQYIEFSKSEHLKSYSLQGSLGVKPKDLKAIDEDKNTGGGISIEGGDDSECNFVQPTMNVICNSNVTAMTEFANGSRKITEGKIFKKQNECIISADFAKLNKLKVGSEIQVTSSFDKNKSIKFTVSGIYTDATKPYGNFPFEDPSMNRRNEIITSFETLTKEFGEKEIMINAEYELKSPDLLSSFEKELRAKGLKDTYEVSTDEISYNKIVAPVVGLSKISMTFMWVVLALGGIILLIISMISVRERKYEIGVLRAMGMKKVKLAVMLMVETLAITIICLAVGLGVGSALSQPVADTMIQSQVKIAEKEDNNNPFDGEMAGAILSGMSTEQNDVKPLSTIDVSLSADAVLRICLVAIVIALLTSSIGVISITRYEPMKILSERN